MGEAKRRKAEIAKLKSLGPKRSSVFECDYCHKPVFNPYESDEGFRERVGRSSWWADKALIKPTTTEEWADYYFHWTGICVPADGDTKNNSTSNKLLICTDCIGNYPHSNVFLQTPITFTTSEI